MASEFFVKQTLKMFYEIARKLINPAYPMPKGGEPIRIVATALNRLEKKYGVLTCQRVTDYVICCAHAFKNRGDKWKLNQVFGKKSMERFNTDKGRVYYEDVWLATKNLTRSDLANLIIDKSTHPKAKYIYLPSEEGTKSRLLNQQIGFVICQTSTLGWSPLSESCSKCNFSQKCEAETSKKYPEIYRLRKEYGNKQ